VLAGLRIEGVPTFDLNYIEFLDKLGEGKCHKVLKVVGAFGKVRLAKAINGGGLTDRQSPSKLAALAPESEGPKEDSVQLCAIKILSKYAIIKAKQVDHVYNELSLQQQLRHPFIVSMKAVQQDSRSLYMMMEYVDGGELYRLIQKEGKLDMPLARFYAAQMVLCFEYLHSKNFIYRDLKPENVLVHQSGYLKLSDFGFIKQLKNNERTYTICGTPEYLAPEIIMNKGHGKPVDWYTLGVFLFEMLSGRCPFMHEDPFEIFKMIVQTKIVFPKDFDKGAKSLIRHLTQHDLSKRFGNLKHGVDDIKNHRFFKDLNFYNVISQADKPDYVPQDNPLRQRKYIVKQKGQLAKYIPENREAEGGSPAVKPSEDPFVKWF
jgi:serine/threonine protein kinase